MNVILLKSAGQRKATAKALTASPHFLPWIPASNWQRCRVRSCPGQIHRTSFPSPQPPFTTKGQKGWRRFGT